MTLSTSTSWEEERNVTLIDSFEKIEDAILVIQKELSIGLDCEGVNLSRDGRICLVQVATSKGIVYVFDILTLEEKVFDSGLRDILESKDIVKIIHDCRRDSDALFHQYSVRLCNVFDTQVADVWFRRNHCLKMPRFVRSYEAALSNYLNLQDLTEKQFGCSLMEKDPEIWSRRPISNALLDYAVIDVIHLHALMSAIKSQMLADLEIGMQNYLSCDRDLTLDHGKKKSRNPDDFEFICNHMKKLNCQAGKKREKRKEVKSSRKAECDPNLFITRRL